MTLDKNMAIPIGTAIMIAVTIVSGHVWINSQLQVLAARLDKINSQIEAATVEAKGEIKRLEAKIDLAKAGEWTRNDMQKWIEEVREKNPMLILPSTWR